MAKQLGAWLPLALAAVLLLAVTAAAAPSDRPPKAQGPKSPEPEQHKPAAPEQHKPEPPKQHKPKTPPMKVKCQENRKLYPYCSGRMMECPATCPRSCYVDCNSCKPVCGEYACA